MAVDAAGDMNDRAWAELVRARDAYTCQYCGLRSLYYSGSFHAHHFHTRSNPETRHDLDNGVTLCPPCHAFFHAHPAAAHEFGEHHLGSERWMRLADRFHGKRDRV